jgi:hypothetical protein
MLSESPAAATPVPSITSMGRQDEQMQNKTDTSNEYSYPSQTKNLAGRRIPRQDDRDVQSGQLCIIYREKRQARPKFHQDGRIAKNNVLGND